MRGAGKRGMMSRTGILQNWITNGTAKPFYARRTFEVKGELRSATALVCGLGQFEFSVNGQKVGDHELDPGWTDYRKYVQYVSFDVLPYLMQGKNALGAEVGNGWYIMELADGHYSFHFPPFMPPNPNPYQPFSECLVLALDLCLTYADGSEELITTDGLWRTAPHPVVESNIFSSETIDGALAQPGWNLPEFDDAEWETAKLTDGPSAPLSLPEQPPVKVIADYGARYLHTVNGRAIYDLGQNASGVLEFEVKGKKGDEIRIYPAEKLDADGDADQMAKNWLMIDNVITYRIGSDDVWEHYRMKFTYYAARYLAVEGTNEGEAQLRGLTGHAITSAHQAAGSFRCDDKRFMQIYDLVEKAVEANMLSVHTDCPTIERFAWQEPNHLMAPSIFYMKDGRGLWKKFFRDMRAAQHTAEDKFHDMAGGDYFPGEGLVPAQAPCYLPNVLPVPGMGDFYDIIAWGSSSILGVYWYYMFYGDLDVVRENYAMGRRYLEHLKTKVTEDGFISHGLGDWGNPVGEFARENVETAFLYADAKTLAYFAGLLGKPEDQAELAAYAESVRKNYNEKLLCFDEEKKRWCYRIWKKKEEPLMTQAAEALPLYWGMVPEDKEADVAEAFREVLERDKSFLCGEVGQPYVIQTAAKYGLHDTITRCILKAEHPSYYAFVLDGETTLGEYWESNPRSHCHDMMGHIIEWYYRSVAGIQPLEPGFKKVLIKPYMPKTVNELDCTYQSVSGPIRVHMKRTGLQVELNVSAAQGIEYRIDRSVLESTTL